MRRDKDTVVAGLSHTTQGQHTIGAEEGRESGGGQIPKPANTDSGLAVDRPTEEYRSGCGEIPKPANTDSRLVLDRQLLLDIWGQRRSTVVAADDPEVGKHRLRAGG